jgi:hypothetical protein
MNTTLITKTIYSDEKETEMIPLAVINNYWEAQDIALELHNSTHSPIFQMNTVIGQWSLPYEVKKAEKHYVVFRHYFYSTAPVYISARPIAVFDSQEQAQDFVDKSNADSREWGDGNWHTLREVGEWQAHHF